MTKDEAKRKLDHSALLEQRDRTRLFGNIDTAEVPLGMLETFSLVMIETEFTKRVQEAFTASSPLFTRLARR